MWRAGVFLAAFSLSVQAFAQDQPATSARGLLDAVRAEIGPEASATTCEGLLDHICRIHLGRSFILATEATNTGDILSVQLIHDEIAVDPPERAAAYVSAVTDVLAGDSAGEVTGLLNEAVQSDGPVERVIGGILYRADAGSDVFLDARPAP